MMGFWVLIVVVFCATQTECFNIPSYPTCKLVPQNPSDISQDPLIDILFRIYKEQAQSESPPAAHASFIEEVNGHVLFARFFIYIDQYLRGDVPDDNKAILDLLETETDEKRWEDFKWPYRCAVSSFAQALDTFIVDILKTIPPGTDLSLLQYSVILRLPQFFSYIGPLWNSKAPLHLLCSKIISSSDPDTEKIITKYQGTMRALLPVADAACKPPYGTDNKLFCSFTQFQKSLQYMEEEYKKAANSTEMKQFALFWFLTPGMEIFCGDSINAELSTKVIIPFSKFAVAKLDEITKLTSTTGADLQKIRTFIYDYCFSLLTTYVTDSRDTSILPSNVLSPFTEEDDPDRKYVGRRHIVLNNPNVEKDILQCFKYFVLRLGYMELALKAEANIDEIQMLARTALFWFLHPDFHLDSNQYYNSFLEGIEYKTDDTNSLVRLGKAVKRYKTTICTTSGANRPAKYCNLYDVLLDIRIFTDTFEEKAKVKIINPSSNYKTILELGTMRSIQADIAALQVNQEQLEQSIFNMRSTLGDHFHQLATFDQEKAQYDFGYLQDKIADFTERISETKIKDKLYNLLHLAIGSNTAEMAQLVTQLAAAVAQNCNPIAWLTGGGGVQDVLDQANALAIAGVDTAKLIALHEDIFPQLTEKGRQISNAVASNAIVHSKLSTTFNQLKNQSAVDIDVVQENFLTDYGAYDPGWSSGDITDYTVLLKEVIEQLCDILYGGETTASAVVQIIGASKLTCLKIKVDAEIIDAVYQEMYEFQYDFMEAMAQAMRALITKHSANTVRNIPEEADDPPTYRLRLKSYTHRIKLQSKQHILLALKDVCDVDEYRNGGAPTDECKNALQSFSPSDIDQVIGRKITECPADQTGTYHVRFPAVLNPDGATLEAGILDLTKLYAGELTEFQIPFTRINQWTTRFASTFIPIDPEVGLYVKRMEIYLPDLTPGTQHEIRVIIKQDGLTTVPADGSVKYGFSTPKEFNLNYGENKLTCPNGFEDSPYPTLCEPGPSKLCIASKGVVSENEIAPPLHSKWLIRFVIPNNLPMPKPGSYGGAFYMRGVLTVCYKNPKNIDLGETGHSNINLENTVTDKCCPDGEYWYISDYIYHIQLCSNCEEGYSTKLGGLYCHKDPTKHKKKHAKHHHYRLQHKENNFLNFATRRHNMLKKRKAKQKSHN